MQARLAGDLERIGPDAFNFGPHRDKAMGQIGDFGFAGRIGDCDHTIGKGRRHQGVFGRTNRYLREQDMPALEPFWGAGFDIALGQVDFSTHRLKRLQMQVNRTVTNRTATGQRHTCHTTPRHQRPQHQNRCPHFADQIIGCGCRCDFLGRHFQNPTGMAAIGRMAVQMQRDTMLPQQVGHRCDIGQMRQVGKGQRLIGQKGCCHQRKGRILGTANCNFALQAATAGNLDLVHSILVCPCRLRHGGYSCLWRCRLYGIAFITGVAA